MNSRSYTLACPEEAKLRAYVTGELEEADAEALSHHLEECRHCQPRVDQLVRTDDSLVEALRRSETPERRNESARITRMIKRAERLDAGASPAPAPDRVVASPSNPVGDIVELETLVACLRKSQLVNSSEVDLLVEQINPASTKSFVRELIARKKLTVFQARALMQGKWRGLVLGNYVILEKLGSGGMGSVFKARHRRMGRVVCLKVLHSSSRNSAEHMARFRREAQTVAALKHPNIVVAHDADDAEGIPFLVMEFIDGSDLARHVQEHGPFRPREAASLVLEAARALHYAHRQGVIHRDVKPHNLLLDGNGAVKVLDMGLARFDAYLDDHPDASKHTSMTQTGVVMGTVDYMSPEQALNSRHADACSDVYSLGCTLYFLVAGRAAYDGETVMEKLVAHRECPIPSLRQANADCTTDIDAVFHKMLAKHIDDRYANMAPLIADLETYLSGGVPSAMADLNKAGTPMARPISPVPLAQPLPVESTVPLDEPPPIPDPNSNWPLPPPHHPAPHHPSPPHHPTSSTIATARNSQSTIRETVLEEPALDETAFAPLANVPTPASRQTAPRSKKPRRKILLGILGGGFLLLCGAIGYAMLPSLNRGSVPSDARTSGAAAANSSDRNDAGVTRSQQTKLQPSLATPASFSTAANGGRGRVMIVVPRREYDANHYRGLVQELNARGIQHLAASSIAGKATAVGAKESLPVSSIENYRAEDFDGVIFCGGKSVREFMVDGGWGSTVVAMLQQTLAGNRFVASIGNGGEIVTSALKQTAFEGDFQFGGHDCLNCGTASGWAGQIVLAPDPGHSGKLLDYVAARVLGNRQTTAKDIKAKRGGKRKHRDTYAGGGPGRALLVVPQGYFYEEDYTKVKQAFAAKGVRIAIASSGEGHAKPKHQKIKPVSIDLSLTAVQPRDFDMVVFTGGNTLHEFGHKSGGNFRRTKEFLSECKEAGVVLAAVGDGKHALQDAGLLGSVRNIKSSNLMLGDGKSGKTVVAPGHEQASQLVDKMILLAQQP